MTKPRIKTKPRTSFTLTPNLVARIQNNVISSGTALAFFIRLDCNRVHGYVANGVRCNELLDTDIGKKQFFAMYEHNVTRKQIRDDVKYAVNELGLEFIDESS